MNPRIELGLYNKYNSMSYKDVKEECTRLGISCYGLHQEYVKKLVAYEMERRVLIRLPCSEQGLSSTHPIPIVPRAISSASSRLFPLLDSQIHTIRTHCAPFDPPLSFLQVPIAFVRRVELTPPSSLQSPKQNASNQTKQPSKTQAAPAATLFHSKPSPTHQPKFTAASSHTPSCEPNGSPPFPPKPFVPSLSRPAPVIQSPAISPIQSPKQTPLSSPLARQYFVPIKKEKEPPSATLSPPSPKKNTRYMDITQRTKIPEWARSKQLKTELRKQYWLERYFVDKVMLMNCRMEQWMIFLLFQKELI